MKIVLNGGTEELDDGESAASLLLRFGFEMDDVLAILNGDAIGKESFDKPLKDGDRLDIMQFAGGG